MIEMRIRGHTGPNCDVRSFLGNVDWGPECAIGVASQVT